MGVARVWVTEGKLPERVKGQVSFDDFVQLIATYCLFNREDMLMCACCTRAGAA